MVREDVSRGVGSLQEKKLSVYNRHENKGSKLSSEYLAPAARSSRAVSLLLQESSTSPESKYTSS